MRIAIVYNGIEDITGGGGAERFFTDFFNVYNNQHTPFFQLYFLSDCVNILQKQGKLNFHTSNIIRLKNWSNRFKRVLEGLNFAIVILRKRIRLVHFANYQFYEDYHRIAALNILPPFLRPKIVINIVDCRLAYQLVETNTKANSSYYKLFQAQKIDAVYSWYVLFKEYFDKSSLFKSPTYIEPIKSLAIDSTKFSPSEIKQNIIIFASRLVSYKNPAFFVDGVAILFKRNPQMLGSWSILIYGKGELLEQLQEQVNRNELQNLVKFGFDADMSTILNISKCFISTQELENFTSLSMMEAMASGNAIISRNVGQTNYLVKDGLNGYLLKKDTPEGLADALEEYLLHPERHKGFQRESVRIIKEIHTPDNFIKQTDNFWKKVLSS
jgi:glycosyltransferase involved in cell wall biosynthesis